MFCPNCGKPTKDTDNFCRFCGADLRCNETSDGENFSQEVSEQSETEFVENFNIENDIQEDETEEIFDTQEELVLYEIKKHWMSLFLPAFLTPLFLAYFWNVFLNTHSIFSWVVVFVMLGFIIYPSMRFKADKFVITNKFAHIKTGIHKPLELDIPISKFEMFDIQQTAFGKLLGYGIITFCVNSEKYDFKYIDAPEYAQYIFKNPKKFIKESL